MPPLSLLLYDACMRRQNLICHWKSTAGGSCPAHRAYWAIYTGKEGRYGNFRPRALPTLAVRAFGAAEIREQIGSPSRHRLRRGRPPSRGAEAGAASSTRAFRRPSTPNITPHWTRSGNVVRGEGPVHSSTGSGREDQLSRSSLAV